MTVELAPGIKVNVLCIYSATLVSKNSSRAQLSPFLYFRLPFKSPSLLRSQLPRVLSLSLQFPLQIKFKDNYSCSLHLKPPFPQNPLFIIQVSQESIPFSPHQKKRISFPIFAHTIQYKPSIKIPSCEMGVSEKLHSMDSGAVDAEKWVISAGIALRSSLKPVFTKAADADEDFPTTPTYAESRIPVRLPCPPAPKKRKPAPAPARSCHYGGVREFFNPPDLETIFIRRVEGA